jgi:type IV pilus assembly protein PilY1
MHILTRQPPQRPSGYWPALGRAAMLAGAVASLPAHAFSPLQEPHTTRNTPANVLLALSVEYPTGLQVSYPSANFNPGFRHEGYFDPERCYAYNRTGEYFQTASFPPTVGPSTGSCGLFSDLWSGNLLNWLTATNLDQFRKVMTGGTRDTFSPLKDISPGDTPEQTILIKSFSDRGPHGSNSHLQYNGYKFMAPATPGYPRVGFDNNPTWGNARLVARTAGYGTKLLIRRFSSEPTRTEPWLNARFPSFNENNPPDWQKSSCAATTGLDPDISCFNVRVQVCDNTGAKAIEPHCNAISYSGRPKPEGLVQRYADRLRFGAMGYLNHNGNDRNGGVLRAPLRSVGSTKLTAEGLVPNDEPEWDLATGVFRTNPNPQDAAQSAAPGVPIPSSGLVNYINRFGYESGYKGQDPSAELYYASLLYLRGKLPPAEYAALPTNANERRRFLDGFPAVTGTDLLAGGPRDPIVNSCQKNFVVGLSDIYTWCDGSLPGSTTTGGCNPPFSLAGETLNVEQLWGTVQRLEGLPGGRNAPNGWVGGDGAHATPYLAGLAHWAHTNDIRPDMQGTQTVRTLWVDMLQNTNNQTSVDAALKLKTPLWLAAKYGGFNKAEVNGNNPNTTRSAWDSNGDGIPDSLFAGNSASQLTAGLGTAFAQIAADAGIATASAPVVSQRVEGPDTRVFAASYNPATWRGELRACSTSQTEDACEDAPLWNASDWLRPAGSGGIAPLSPAQRKLITSWGNGNNFASMPFVYNRLNADQRIALGGTGRDRILIGQDLVDYVRGVRAREDQTLRKRGPHVLGSIVNSNVTYLGRSNDRYSAVDFPDHVAYRNSTSTRPPVLYVGANDGMLHAFSAANGMELFAYIPASVLPRLPTLAAPETTHLYMVDSTPMVGDFQNSKDSNRWGTLLVGGLGGGGRGYYALNITQQSNFANMTEAALASALPMWEFGAAQDPDLGFTYNEPAQDSVSGRFLQIAKAASNEEISKKKGSKDAVTESGRWVVAVGNGYGSRDGKAVLYLLDAATGSVFKKLTVPGLSPNNGLSAPTPLDTDGDGLIDTIYAGDLQGYIHRFSYSRTVNGQWSLGTPGSREGDTGWRYIGAVFRATDATGKPQPITTAVTVGPRCGAANGLALSVGTGKLNEAVDSTDTSPQMFFTFFDRGATTPGKTKTPLLVNSTQLATVETFQGVTLANGLAIRNWTAPTNTTLTWGWRMPLQDGERVLGNATLPPDTGAVLFGVTRPSGDVCTPGEGGYIVAVDQCSGSTTTLLFDGQLVGGFEVATSGVVKVAPAYRKLDGSLFAGSNQKGKEGGGTSSFGTLTDNLAPPGRYSWREVLGF